MADVRVKAVGLTALAGQARQRANINPILQSVHQNLENIWRDAAEAFIREAVRNVLIETGMTAASFFPLSRAIRRVKAEAAIRSKLLQRGQGTTGGGIKRQRTRSGIPEFPSGQRSGGTQGPAAGIERGQNAYIFEVGSPRAPIFRFRFETAVFQHAIHEPSQRSLERGIRAFAEVVNERFRAVLPTLVTKYLRGQKI